MRATDEKKLTSNTHNKTNNKTTNKKTIKVWKGYLQSENKFVALKKINILQKETRAQLLNDVKALCDAPGAPGLIAFFGAYHVPDSGQVCLVLEYMDGGSLADVLKKV